MVVEDDPTYGFAGAADAVVFGDSLFVVNQSTGTITEMSISTRDLTKVIDDAAIVEPFQIAATEGRLRVTSYGENVVYEIDADTGVVQSTIGGFNCPSGIVVVGDDLWVTSNCNARLMIIDTATAAITATLDDASYEFGYPFLLDYDGSHIWVPSTTGRLTKLSPVESAGSYLVDAISDADTPVDAPSLSGSFGAVSDGGSVWVSNNQTRTVTQFDAATGAFVRALDMPGAVGAMAYDDDYLYVPSVDDNSVRRYEKTTGELVDTLTDPSTQITNVAEVIIGPSGPWLTNGRSVIEFTGLPTPTTTTTTTTPVDTSPSSTIISELPATGNGRTNSTTVIAVVLGACGAALLLASRRTV